MNGQTLSLLGMVNYDDSILDAFSFPSGINKDQTVQEIILQTAELELIYPDWDIMNTAIKLWCQRMTPIWTKLLKTTNLEYNPIWNKDGKVTEVEDRDLHEETSSNGTGVHDVAGYNSPTLVTSDKDTSNASGTSDHSGQIKRTRIEQGNIGVTTTQQMIREEREIDQFDLTSEIVRSFKKRFCILVY